MSSLRDITDELFREEETLRLGGGADGQERQRRLGRLPVRERLALLLDEGRPFFELGIWAAYRMYPEWGDVPAAGIVTGIGWVSGRPCLDRGERRDGQGRGDVSAIGQEAAAGTADRVCSFVCR